MYFYPIAACRDPTRGQLDSMLTICKLVSPNRGLSQRAKLLLQALICLK